MGCRHKSTITAWLSVIDVNDNTPVFKGNSSYSVFENEIVGPQGFPVTHIIATDADSNVDESGNGVLAFSIVDGNEEGHFAIDRSSGECTLKTFLWFCSVLLFMSFGFVFYLLKLIHTNVHQHLA